MSIWTLRHRFDIVSTSIRLLFLTTIKYHIKSINKVTKLVNVNKKLNFKLYLCENISQYTSFGKLFDFLKFLANSSIRFLYYRIIVCMYIHTCTRGHKNAFSHEIVRVSKQIQSACSVSNQWVIVIESMSKLCRIDVKEFKSTSIRHRFNIDFIAYIMHDS